MNLDLWLFHRLVHQLKLSAGLRSDIDGWQATRNEYRYSKNLILVSIVKTLLGSDIKCTSKIIKNIPRIIETEINKGDATNFSIVNLFYGSKKSDSH